MTKRLLILLLSLAAIAAPKRSTREQGNVQPVLWQDPVDIASRDTTWGPGGASHQPHGPFRFVEEDSAGTSAKFVITDADGTKWKVKLGPEARPETAASRLVWAAGYFADENYYLPALQVTGIPSLKRGSSYVEPNGLVHGARLKRYLKGEEKEGHWEWRANPFFGSREFNGLRVLMALIDNWDLKDVNNGVYEYEGRKIYLVTDLGSSFATDEVHLSRAADKGNLANYTASQFIKEVAPPLVSFGTPGRPPLLEAVVVNDYRSRVNMEWIGRNIPIDDARWMGSILSRLTPQQIEAAFVAAGFSPAEVAGFSTEVEARIAALNKL